MALDQRDTESRKGGTTENWENLLDVLDHEWSLLDT